MTPDTSTQAMEAIAEYLEVLRQPYWADKVRIVAAERDNARRTALEDAAKVADNFAQSPIEDDFDEGYEQAAFEIRDLIRALIKEEQK